MNNKADFAPIRWSYKKTREIARRMDAFRGELTSHHPRFHPDSFVLSVLLVFAPVSRTHRSSS
jgi:hypothetical protein